MDLPNFKGELETIVIIDTALYFKERNSAFRSEDKESPEDLEKIRRFKGILEDTYFELRSKDRTQSILFILQLIQNELLQSKAALKLVVELILIEQLNGRIDRGEVEMLVKGFQEIKETVDKNRFKIASEFLVNSHVIYFTKPENTRLGKYRVNILGNQKATPDLVKLVLGNIEEMVESDTEISQAEIRDLIDEIVKTRRTLGKTPTDIRKSNYMTDTCMKISTIPATTM